MIILSIFSHIIFKICIIQRPFFIFSFHFSPFAWKRLTMCLNELWFIINYKDDTFWYLLIRPVQKINKAHVSLISNFPFVLFYYNHRGEMETHIQELCIEWNSENRSRVLSENVGGKTRGATVFIWMWSE